MQLCAEPTQLAARLGRSFSLLDAAIEQTRAEGKFKWARALVRRRQAANMAHLKGTPTTPGSRPPFVSAATYWRGGQPFIQGLGQIFEGEGFRHGHQVQGGATILQPLRLPWGCSALFTLAGSIRAARLLEYRAALLCGSVMASTARVPAVKVVGANGQITLGKQYAGRQVLVEVSEPGVWIVRTATVIPDNERWLHQSAAAADLQAAMAWSVTHPPGDADLEDTLKRLGHGE